MTVYGNGSSYSTVVEFACQEGFEIHGANRIFCTSDSSWSHPSPACLSKSYISLSLLLNIYIKLLLSLFHPCSGNSINMYKALRRFEFGLQTRHMIRVCMYCFIWGKYSNEKPLVLDKATFTLCRKMGLGFKLIFGDDNISGSLRSHILGVTGTPKNDSISREGILLLEL